jgi:hypothetical protein
MIMNCEYVEVSEKEVCHLVKKRVFIEPVLTKDHHHRTMGQFSSVHTNIPYSSKFVSDILASMPWSLKWFIPVQYSRQILYVVRGRKN